MAVNIPCETVKGVVIYPAHSVFGINVFTSEKLAFQKPRWLEDRESLTCYHCTQKFTTLKRKHHCRQCGRIFCSQCCKDKMLMIYMGYDGPERVCEQCKPIVDSFVLAYSPQSTLQYEAAKSLVDFCKNPATQLLMVEIGGVHLLIYIAKNKDNVIRAEVIEGFRFLVDGLPELHYYFATIGLLHMISSILSHTEDVDILEKALIIANKLLVSPRLKSKAVEAGLLTPLHHLVASTNHTTAVMALKAFISIVEDGSTHVSVIDKRERNYIVRIIKQLHSKNEEIIVLTLKLLAHLSYGSDSHRQRLMQEDVYNGCCLLTALKCKPENIQILINAACLAANLAGTKNTQGGLREQLIALGNLIPEYFQNEDLMLHVSRGLANYARYDCHSSVLVEFLPYIVTYYLQNPNIHLRQYGLQIVVALLQFSPEEVLQVLQRNGATDVLRCITENRTTLEAVYSKANELLSPILLPDT